MVSHGLNFFFFLWQSGRVICDNSFWERLNTEKYWNYISRINRLYVVIHIVLSGANFFGFEEQLN